LTSRALDLIVRQIGKDAGLQISAHVLRHTMVTNLVRAGNDIVLVAELAGHRRLETTRRYSLPSEADRATAVEALASAELWFTEERHMIDRRGAKRPGDGAVYGLGIIDAMVWYLQAG
jgi:integrase